MSTFRVAGKGRINRDKLVRFSFDGTDYTGFDPETNLGGGASGNRGIDWFNNPISRSWVITVGLNR